jgi:hypothetical protein
MTVQILYLRCLFKWLMYGYGMDRLLLDGRVVRIYGWNALYERARCG